MQKRLVLRLAEAVQTNLVPATRALDFLDGESVRQWWLRVCEVAPLFSNMEVGAEQASVLIPPEHASLQTQEQLLDLHRRLERYVHEFTGARRHVWPLRSPQLPQSDKTLLRKLVPVESDQAPLERIPTVADVGTTPLPTLAATLFAGLRDASTRPGNRIHAYDPRDPQRVRATLRSVSLLLHPGYGWILAAAASRARVMLARKEEQKEDTPTTATLWTRWLLLHAGVRLLALAFSESIWRDRKQQSEWYSLRQGDIRLVVSALLLHVARATHATFKETLQWYDVPVPGDQLVLYSELADAIAHRHATYTTELETHPDMYAQWLKRMHAPHVRDIQQKASVLDTLYASVARVSGGPSETKWTHADLLDLGLHGADRLPLSTRTPISMHRLQLYLAMVAVMLQWQQSTVQDRPSWTFLFQYMQTQRLLERYIQVTLHQRTRTDFHAFLQKLLGFLLLLDHPHHLVDRG